MDVRGANFLLSGNVWMTYFAGLNGNDIKQRGTQSALLKMRPIRGEFHNQYFDVREDESAFYDYMSMSLESFDYICNMIRDDCNHVVTNYRRPISVEERLVLTIRYLTTGTSFRKLLVPFRISKTAIASIVLEVCTAVWRNMNGKHMKLPSTEEFKYIADSFLAKNKFPHCCGNLDGKHIRIKKPAKCGSMYYNYKMYNSIVLLAVTDSKNKFIIIDVGAYGKDSDGGVLSNSSFYQKLENGGIQLPPEEPLPNSNIVAPYVFLGDEAFPLKTYIMRPYPRRQATDVREIRFNKRLSSTRVGVECAFGMMASKFRVLYKPIETSVENALKIVKTICLLHNILIDMDKTYSHQHITDLQRLINRRRYNTLTTLNRTRRNNNMSGAAISARQKFTTYFSNQS